MKKVKLHLNYAGFCLANESHTIKGGRNEKIRFHALWGLIKHPEKGWILFDTGYTKRFYEATYRFPDKIYALLTEVFIESKDEIKSQIEKNGLTPYDIKYIIISHFHADHIGGLIDFPDARIYVSKDALMSLKKSMGPLAVTNGILKSLIPNDIFARSIIIEEQGKEIQIPPFGKCYDIFNDNSIIIVPLPGHAAGQVGVVLETHKNSYFLISDACWLRKSFEQNILPNPIVRLFFDSWYDYKKTLKKIRQFHQISPSVRIVPTHCNLTTKELVSDKISMNVL